MKNIIFMIFCLLLINSCGKENVDNNLKPEQVPDKNYVVNSINGLVCNSCVFASFGKNTIALNVVQEFLQCQGNIFIQNTEEIIIPKNNGEVFDLFLIDEYINGDCEIAVNSLYLEKDNDLLILNWDGEELILTVKNN